MNSSNNEQELKDRIKRAGYKLGGQIVTFDNGKQLAEGLAIKCDLLVNSVKGRIQRRDIDRLSYLLQSIKNDQQRLNYAYSSAIEQNMAIRNLLENGDQDE